jgi:hypothetical protein
MKSPAPSHSLLMLDPAGSRSFARLSCSLAHARRVAECIAAQQGLRVRLELDGGDREYFEPERAEVTA